MRSKEQILSEIFATLWELENNAGLRDKESLVLYHRLCVKLEVLMWLCDEDEVPEEYWERISHFVPI